MFKKQIVKLISGMLVIIMMLSTNNVFAALENQNGNSEKKYIIGFKTQAGKEKIEKDTVKSKKIKKDFKKQKSLVVDLTDAQVKEMQNSSDVSYIEADALAEILSVDKPNKNSEVAKKIKKK